jgi:hypothetical protein
VALVEEKTRCSRPVPVPEQREIATKPRRNVNAPPAGYAAAVRRVTAALPVLAAAALASCGASTVDRGNAERLIRDAVADQIHARVASVRCPADVEQEAGRRFTCVVTGSDGSRGDANVTQREGGGLSITAPFLDVREAEAVMTERLATSSKLRGIKVACPEIVVVKKDARFTCKASAAGKPRTITARLTDAAGHFQYRLR